MGSAKSNIVLSALLELFESYIKDRSHFVDFFLLDYCIATLYDEVPQVRDIIDTIPLNNPEFYALNSVVNSGYDEKLWSDINLARLYVINQRLLDRESLRARNILKSSFRECKGYRLLRVDIDTKYKLILFLPFPIFIKCMKFINR